VPLNDAQGGGPAGDQSSRDGGVVPKHKVPGKIAPRVGSSRWFPGEFLNVRFGRWRRLRLLRLRSGRCRFESCRGNYPRVAELAKRLMFRGRLFPGQRNVSASSLCRNNSGLVPVRK
jgi:hypothetical protein